MYPKHDYTIGVVGARGFVGRELVSLITNHPVFSIGFVSSRSSENEITAEIGSKYTIQSSPQNITEHKTDAIVLAVPDGMTEGYLDCIGDRVVLDLSSDHRFDSDWCYGLSEHNCDTIRTARYISNPGCYATAIQLAARPLLPLIDGTIHAFGVSGFSGAGSSPSDHNDPEQLADGIAPYKLVGHTHEREAARHLGISVRFTPHVAPFYRGIVLTLHASASRDLSREELVGAFQSFYTESTLVSVLDDRVPRVQEIVHSPGAEIGGITLGEDARSIAVVCTLDNLLKGAASQAIQNLNLAFGLDSVTGLEMETCK